jgi:hypothetical protein
MAPRANARRFFNGANIMIKHKKFKTVSGYLRSNEYRILSKLPTDRDTEEDRRRRVEVVQAGQREGHQPTAAADRYPGPHCRQ